MKKTKPSFHIHKFKELAPKGYIKYSFKESLSQADIILQAVPENARPC